jgi:hypothetical protein
VFIKTRSWRDYESLFSWWHEVMKLTSQEIYMVGGKKYVVVENPKECENFDHIIGHNIEIDGIIEKVIGVERFCHCPPWSAGEKIGLLIGERVEENNE